MSGLVERWRVPGSIALVGLVVLATGGLDCGGGGGNGGSPPPSGPPEILTACTSSGTPAGYVKINDNWDPTSCGSPTTITYNVSTYRRYDNKPVGTYMTVCSGQQPAGWVMTNSHWDPTSCGHPSSIFDNMWQIRRIS